MSPLYSKFILTVLSGVSSTAADLDSQTEATSTIPDPNSHSDYNIFNEDPESVKIIRSENYHDGMGNYKIEYKIEHCEPKISSKCLTILILFQLRFRHRCFY